MRPISSIPGVAAISAISPGTSLRTSGSPPVIRTLRKPCRAENRNHAHDLIVRKTTVSGSANGSPSAGMQ